MKLPCPSCSATLSVDAHALPPQGANILCSRCQHLFFVPAAPSASALQAPPPSQPVDSILGTLSPLPAAPPHLHLQESLPPQHPPQYPPQHAPQHAPPPGPSPHIHLIESMPGMPEALPGPSPQIHRIEGVPTVPGSSPHVHLIESAHDAPPPLPAPAALQPLPHSLSLAPLSHPSAPAFQLASSHPPLPPAFSASSSSGGAGLPHTPTVRVAALNSPTPAHGNPMYPAAAIRSAAEHLASPTLSADAFAATPASAFAATRAAPPHADRPALSPGRRSQPPPKPKKITRKTLALLAAGLLALAFAAYSFRPAFLFPSPQVASSAPAPLPSASAMQAILLEGNSQAVQALAQLTQVPSRANAEQALLWARSVFVLPFLNATPEPPQLKEASRYVDALPADMPASAELLKTRAAYALASGKATLAMEILSRLPQAEPESDWLRVQAYAQQGAFPQATQLLSHSPDMFEPRRQQTLGDLAFAQGAYASAMEAYGRARAHPPLQAEMELRIAKAWLHAHHPEKTLEQLAHWESAPLAPSLAPQAWRLMALAQLELELYSEAASTLEKLKTYPSLFAQPMAQLFVATSNPKKAAALLADEVRKYPDNFGLAQHYLHALLLDSQTEQAHNFVEQLLQTHPDNADAWLLAASTFQQLGAWESALEAVDKTLSLQPQNVQAKLQWAKLQQRLGHAKAAHNALLAATAQSPHIAEFWVALGAFLFENNKLPQAKHAYAQALRQQPRCLEAFIGLAHMALKETNMGELRRYVQSIEEINPRSPEGAWLSSHLLWAEGAKKEATEKLDWAIRRNSTHLEFWLSKALMALEDKQLPRAEEALARARQLNPSLAMVNYLSGLFFEAQEDFKKAQQHFQKAAAADKTNPAFPLAQSRVLMAYQRPLEAAALLKKVTAEFPSNTEAPMLLGLYYQQRHRFKAALPFFLHTLAIEPNHLEALRHAADCLLELTQWTRALAMLERLFQHSPEDSGLMAQLGRASFEAGHYAQAIRWYEKSLAKAPLNPPAVLNMAWAFKELGRKQQAIQAFKNYLQLHPSAPNRKMVEDEMSFLR